MVRSSEQWTHIRMSEQNFSTNRSMTRFSFHFICDSFFRCCCLKAVFSLQLSCVSVCAFCFGNGFSCVISLNLIRFTCTGFNGNLSVFYSDVLFILRIDSCYSRWLRVNMHFSMNCSGFRLPATHLSPNATINCLGFWIKWNWMSCFFFSLFFLLDIEYISEKSCYLWYKARSNWVQILEETHNNDEYFC